MTNPNFLHQLTKEQLRKLSQDDIQKIYRIEQIYWAYKPYIDIYKVKAIPLALVADETKYAEVSTAKIFTSAGSTISVHNQSSVLVGSPLENGDEIIDKLITSHVLRFFHDAILPERFMTPTVGGSKNV